MENRNPSVYELALGTALGVLAAILFLTIGAITSGCRVAMSGSLFQGGATTAESGPVVTPTPTPTPTPAPAPVELP